MDFKNGTLGFDGVFEHLVQSGELLNGQDQIRSVRRFFRQFRGLGLELIRQFLKKLDVLPIFPFCFPMILLLSIDLEFKL
jgi:hypothetical protein